MQDLSTEETLRHLEQAEQLKLTGNYEEALQILEELLVEDPANISALEEVADNELRMNHLERAEAAASQAIDLDAKSYMGHYILGATYAMQERWTEGLLHLQQANILQPNNSEILRALGWILLHCNKRTQGVVTLERALNLDDENPLTLCDLGIAYMQANNIPKAKALFLRSLDIDPQNARARKCVQTVEKIEHTVKNRHMTRRGVVQA